MGYPLCWYLHFLASVSLSFSMFFLLSLPQVFSFLGLSSLSICFSSFFSQDITPWRCPSTASILSVPKQLSDSISMTHSLQNTIPAQDWVLCKQVTGFPLEQWALLGLTSAQTRHLEERGGSESPATGSKEDEPPGSEAWMEPMSWGQNTPLRHPDTAYNMNGAGGSKGTTLPASFKKA